MLVLVDYRTRYLNWSMTWVAGRSIDLKSVPNADLGMSPMELWCNEAQERYVIALSPEGLEWFEAACQRERCPYAVVGRTNTSGDLLVTDLHSDALRGRHADG